MLEFPIAEVADRLGLRFIKACTGGQRIYRCPFCGDSTKHLKKGHLYLDTENNLYYCHRCGCKGNSVTLWAYARRTDTRLAYKELCTDIKPEEIYPRQHQPQAQKNQEQASLKERNSVYYSFLQKLPLYERHKQALIGRGLNEEAITENMYKSVPDTAQERWRVCKSLSSNGLCLNGIPGFFTRDKYWDFYALPGYFIPVRSVSGEIQGLQIRAETYNIKTCTKPKTSYITSNGVKKAVAWVEAILDGEKEEKVFISGSDGNYKAVIYDLDSESTVVARKMNINGHTVLNLYRIDDGKYRWFSSSGMTNGSPARAYAHYAKCPNHSKKNGRLWLTEGPLKADVASCLIGDPFIGSPSISSLWEAVHPILSEVKPKIPFAKKEVIVAFDADVKEKPYLLETLQDFLLKLKNNGFKPINATWPSGDGKGIDDVLLKLTRDEVREIAFTLNSVPISLHHKSNQQ